MNNKKYKILVFSDLKKSSETVIRSSVNLSKMIGGEVSVFHVKKPTEVVERDNQLSVMRSINKKHTQVNKQIKNLLEPISKDLGLKISYTSAFGNLKREIENHIKTYKPDVIVLGKRKSNFFKLIGDNLIDVILKNHKGTVMIASHDKGLQPNDALSLGVLNTNLKSIKSEIVDVLTTKTQQPIKLFTIDKNAVQNKNNNENTEKRIVEYVFEKGVNAIDNVSKYALKSNVNLMFVDNNKTLKSVMNKVNTSLIYSN